MIVKHQTTLFAPIFLNYKDIQRGCKVSCQPHELGTINYIKTILLPK